MLKAVIFDLDGTLLDTLDDLYESTAIALKKFSFPQRSGKKSDALSETGLENWQKGQYRISVIPALMTSCSIFRKLMKTTA